MKSAARLGLLLSLGLVAPLSRADTDAVVVRVGDASLTASELEQRMRAMAPFQLQSLGASPAEVRRTYVNEQAVVELLYVEEAKRRKLEQTPVVADRIREVLRQALEAEIRDEITKSNPVTPREIKAYYDENTHRFNTPARIKLWRILVDSEAEAQQILTDVRQSKLKGTVVWTQKAREKSLDKATSMRDGDLGFVHPDGKTETPEVRVDPALYAAADKVKDGEMVTTPVKEGERYAVIWRRGSMPAVERTLEQEERSIRQILMREKLQSGMNDVLAKLEKGAVTGKNTALLSYVDIDPMGDLSERARPGIVPRHKPATPLSPRASERGLR
ncbi:MAG: peptidyl-prolyl cis-trans isomerase [Polyangiaceae bacterium]